MSDSGPDVAVATARAHRSVPSVTVTDDGQMVTSTGGDGTVRFWDISSGAGLRGLRADRRYERMDITGLTGITSVQRPALLALGAVDRSDGAG